MNDPKTLAKLLRAIASGSQAKENDHDIILIAAANKLIEQDKKVQRLERGQGRERL